MPCLQRPVDSNVSQKNSPVIRQTSGSLIRCFLIATLLTTTSGCSLFVLAGKALFGDPKATSALTAATGIALEESKQPVVVISSIPARMMSRFPSLQIDLVDRLTRNMEVHDIKTVPSGDIARWYDDNGEWGDFSELAKHFKSQYVIHVELQDFDHAVEESETLMQGRAEGEITMYQIQRPKSSNLFEDSTEEIIPINQVFFKDFKTQFPASYPVPRETNSEDRFIRLFMDRVALHIGQQIYSYQLSESVN